MRKLPPLNALRAFEAAARHLSFKSAADELFVTPTAISDQIKLLEQLTGQQLFRRRPRPIGLTPAGSRLFPVLRDGFDSFSAAVATLSEEAENAPLRASVRKDDLFYMRIEARLKRKLQRIAKRQGRSMSDLVAMWIEQHEHCRPLRRTAVGSRQPFERAILQGGGRNWRAIPFSLRKFGASNGQNKRSF